MIQLQSITQYKAHIMALFQKISNYYSHLVFLVVVHLVVVLLVVTTVTTVGVSDAHLSVDVVVALDVGLAGEVGPPLSVGVILAAGLTLKFECRCVFNTDNF